MKLPLEGIVVANPLWATGTLYRDNSGETEAFSGQDCSFRT
jgi:hypothetical protein